MTALRLGRLVCYGLVILLAIAVLGLAGNIYHIATQPAPVIGGYEPVVGGFAFFAEFAIAVSILTLLTLITVLLTERIRQNFFLSWTAVELGWLGVLWSLWLASAATSSSAISPFHSTCHSNATGPDSPLQAFAGYLQTTVAGALSFCRRLEAVVGLSWVIWILLTGILFWILGFAIGAHSAGHHGIWQASASQMSGGVGPKTRSTYPMGHEQGIASAGAERDGV